MEGQGCCVFFCLFYFAVPAFPFNGVFHIHLILFFKLVSIVPFLNSIKSQSLGL